MGEWHDKLTAMLQYTFDISFYNYRKYQMPCCVVVENKNCYFQHDKNDHY